MDVAWTDSKSCEGPTTVFVDHPGTLLKQNLRGYVARSSGRIDCFHPLMPMMLTMPCSILQDLLFMWLDLVRIGTA